MQTKQMYSPHSRDEGVFRNWLKQFNVRADIDRHHLILSVYQPERVPSDDKEGKFNNLFHKWLVKIENVVQEETGLNVWLLKFGHYTVNEEAQEAVDASEHEDDEESTDDQVEEGDEEQEQNDKEGAAKPVPVGAQEF
jgi:hypothetical protein